MCEKVGGNIQVQKGLYVWWGEEKKNLGSWNLLSAFLKKLILEKNINLLFFLLLLHLLVASCMGPD